ncbi:LysR family transcriptional regulator [Rhodobacteraceae bacterium RKSG542]|uniref:LysR family transcriptional regulator n=1 Tax=Pseudovibrio flavus TaxID=2529854 RepID=UPI0012BCCF02|nr:LysR family transcriptional regulator [Pseudovibrio flavus]MTI16380.1 LysR family transcriptional regulator [Pseudovibrio flavus]
MNNIYWNGLRSFLAVAESGSFTQAAEQLGMSKASLSQQVTQLEQRLGAQLLFRTTRKLRLTSVGEEYFRLCRGAMKTLEDASLLAREATETLSGTIHINSVGGVIGEDVVAPLTIGFQQAYPQVEVRLDFSSIREDIVDSHYDLVLRMGRLEDSSLIARRVYSLTTRYVASTEFLRGIAPILHPQDLAGMPLIYGSVAEWVFRREQEQVKVKASHGFQITNGRVMTQAALAGFGVARLGNIYTDALIASGKLVEVLPDWQEETQIWLVSPPSRHQLKRVRVLGDWLGKRFAERYVSVRDRATP